MTYKGCWCFGWGAMPHLHVRYRARHVKKMQESTIGKSPASAHDFTWMSASRDLPPPHQGLERADSQKLTSDKG
jgi:hypothetical protein